MCQINQLLYNLSADRRARQPGGKGANRVERLRSSECVVDPDVSASVKTGKQDLTAAEIALKSTAIEMRRVPNGMVNRLAGDERVVSFSGCFQYLCFWRSAGSRAGDFSRILCSSRRRCRYVPDRLRTRISHPAQATPVLKRKGKARAQNTAVRFVAKSPGPPLPRPGAQAIDPSR